MKETISCGGIVVNQKGEILVAGHKKWGWCLPKGHVEKGEDLVTTAKREVYEETGLPTDFLQLVTEKPLGTYQRFKVSATGGDDPSEYKTIHFFHFATTFEGELHPTDPKHPEARWVEKEKVSDLLTHQKDKEFFDSIKDRI